MADSLLVRITQDPEVFHGKPCVRGLRYPVEFVLELLSSGMSFKEVLEDYDDLAREDLQAVLLYAAKLVQVKSIHRVALMRFLVDAQLPMRLAYSLRVRGHDVVHTRDLAEQNKTPDREINAISLSESRIVVTKDADFSASFVKISTKRAKFRLRALLNSLRMSVTSRRTPATS